MTILDKLRNSKKYLGFIDVYQGGGRGGIRTHGTVARTSDFESGAFNHSATLPFY